MFDFMLNYKQCFKIQYKLIHNICKYVYNDYKKNDI